MSEEVEGIDGKSAEEGQKRLNKELVKEIEGLITLQVKLDLDKEALSDEIEATAKKLGIKKAELSLRIKMIVAEQEKGGILQQKTQQIDFVEEFFMVKESKVNN